MAESPLLETERLLIRPFSKEHISQHYIDWLNDKQLTQFSNQRFQTHSYESCLSYWQSFHNSCHYFWAIEEKQTQQHIGNLNAYLDSRHGLADIGILIGAKNTQGKGYATEAIETVINYLFEATDTRKITMGTTANNLSMLKVMEKLGMQDDGVRKAHQVLTDGAVDVVHRALFR